MKKNQKGFTLIELIVVIAIIAILAAIVLVNVTQYIKTSKNAAELADISQLSTAATGYLGNNGNYDAFCTSQEAQKIRGTVSLLIAGNNYDTNLYCTDTSTDNDGFLGQPCINSYAFLAPTPFGLNRYVCIDSAGAITHGDNGDNFTLDANGKCCCGPDGAFATYVCP